MKLHGKTLVLTGASGGIGQALAHALAAAGARLILVGRDAARLAALAGTLPGAHSTVTADLGEAAGRERLLESCRQPGHGVDGLINNAGISDFGSFEQQTPERIAELIHLNLTVPMLLCRSFLPLLGTHPGACIVNIGSTFGAIGHPGFAAYCASKAGLRGFSEALRRELADSTIRVFHLAPRATRTAMNSAAVDALNRALGNAVDEPAVVARALVAQLSDARGSERHLGWPERLFVRVNALLPALVDRALIKKLPVIRQHANPD
jgi:short-subunit dehydrogenase